VCACVFTCVHLEVLEGVSEVFPEKTHPHAHHQVRLRRDETRKEDSIHFFLVARPSLSQSRRICNRKRKKKRKERGRSERQSSDKQKRQLTVTTCDALKIKRKEPHVRDRGRQVPIFLDTLLAVCDVLVDFDQLGLEHHPVRL